MKWNSTGSLKTHRFTGAKSAKQASYSLITGYCVYSCIVTLNGFVGLLDFCLRRRCNEDKVQTWLSKATHFLQAFVCCR